MINQTNQYPHFPARESVFLLEWGGVVLNGNPAVLTLPIVVCTECI
uniref:Uncharacterized protein n=1 Tax=viral metagenome TaxID=1070528 RepID=A0A6C0KEB8_9ZZZZ